MAFTVPTFPITCDVFTGPWLTRFHRDTIPCNLAPGRRVFQNPLGEDPGQFLATAATQILVPALSDVRDFSTGVSHPDVIECPSGSGRWYGVMLVDDLGKGFPNEHRVVTVTKIFELLNLTEYAGLNWPIPIP
jgi:hypothetical protein